jgi:3-polyprenyl-4-hydroxybenzoate decarboxylase
MTLQDSTLSGNSAAKARHLNRRRRPDDSGRTHALGNAATGVSSDYAAEEIDQWVSSGSVSGTIINSNPCSNTAVSAIQRHLAEAGRDPAQQHRRQQ